LNIFLGLGGIQQGRGSWHGGTFSGGNYNHVSEMMSENIRVMGRT
jgi:hypothetical protein